MHRLAAGLALVLASVAIPLMGERNDAPDIQAIRLERRVFDLVNTRRISANRGAMRWDDRLARIARGHSDDMVKRHFFAHVNPDGDDPTARGKHAGYACLKRVSRLKYRDGLAENLMEEPRFRRVRISGGQRTFDWNTLEDIARQSVDGWMRSPGHRENILEPAYDQTGVGIAISPEHVYLTQLFC